MGLFDGPVRQSAAVDTSSVWFFVPMVLGVVVSGLTAAIGSGIGDESITAAVIGGVVGAIALTVAALRWRKRDRRPRPREAAVGLACGGWLMPAIIVVGSLTT